MELYEAFALEPGAIVAAVGGGGKTSLVYALAAEAASRGLSAVVASTVKFTRTTAIQMPPIVEAPAEDIAAALRKALRPRGVVVATSGRGTRGRLLGFDPPVIDRLAALELGLLAVEADGSAHRPFKAPADHEPVIPGCATHVVVCVGLEVLGRPLIEANVHRPEIVSVLAEVPPGAPVTPQVVVRTLLHPLGGKKGVPPGAKLAALLNGPPTAEHERLGTYIGQRLVYGGYSRAVVATAHRPSDIRAVIA